jgi:hypothetical protein
MAGRFRERFHCVLRSTTITTATTWLVMDRKTVGTGDSDRYNGHGINDLGVTTNQGRKNNGG